MAGHLHVLQHLYMLQSVHGLGRQTVSMRFHDFLGPFLAGILAAIFQFRVLYEYIVLYPLSVCKI